MAPRPAPELPFALCPSAAAHCPLDKGSTFPVQLCLRWNVPDISVSVQHSCFVGSMSVRNRRDEQSGRAVNSE